MDKRIVNSDLCFVISQSVADNICAGRLPSSRSYSLHSCSNGTSSHVVGNEYLWSFMVMGSMVIFRIVNVNPITYQAIHNVRQPCSPLEHYKYSLPEALANHTSQL